MFALNTLIITGLIAFAAGALISAIVMRRSHASAPRPDLEKRLTEAEDTLHNYQRDVTEHFVRTADLVNTLTENYRSMHEHLASSALKLTTPEVSRQLLDSARNHLAGDDDTQITTSNIEPPRDWAPKRHGSKGALSEDYGLVEQELESEPEDADKTS